MSKMDLHMHSITSEDGQYTVEELIHLAQQANLEIIAIADHNTVKAAQYAQTLQSPIKIIPAVELDCTFEGHNLHLLGYGIDLNHPGFHEVEETIMTQMKQMKDIQVRKIEEMGIIIDKEQLEKQCPDGIVVGEDIAEVALQDPRNDNNPVLLPYRPNGARSQNPYVNFYWDICAAGKPAYVPIHYPTIEEAIQLIHEAHGICVLAHPGNNFKNHPEIVEKILQLPIEGIEAYSSYHTYEQMAYYQQLADQYHKIVTLGSDFHGKTKPSIHMGSIDSLKDENMIRTDFLNYLKNGCF
ncbi:MAG: PHP domain-containing protein [Erysipelotrichaceae bacterium]|nr:PHP domain-containing protein [Erysipelotrichaceae bacterium]